MKKVMIDCVYGKYSLSAEGLSRQFSAHILVASFFIEGKSEERCFVNHRDENKLNCHYTNLEWVTQKENMMHYANRRRFDKVIEQLKQNK